MTSLTRPLCILIKGTHFLRGKPHGTQGEPTNGVNFQHSPLLTCDVFDCLFLLDVQKWNTAAIKSIVLFMASLFIGFLVERCVACQNRKSDFGYPVSRGYIFAVWAGVRKVASADNRSIFYRACAKFVTRFASNWFVKSAWVSRESNLRKLLANNSPRAFVLFFCFGLSGFKYFSCKISTDRLF